MRRNLSGLAVFLLGVLLAGSVQASGVGPSDVVLDKRVYLPLSPARSVDPCIEAAATIVPVPVWEVYYNAWSGTDAVVWLYVETPPECASRTFWACSAVPIPEMYPWLTPRAVIPYWVQLPRSCPYIVVGGYFTRYRVYLRVAQSG